MSSLIEQAAERLAQLRAAGVEVPDIARRETLRHVSTAYIARDRRACDADLAVRVDVDCRVR